MSLCYVSYKDRRPRREKERSKIVNILYSSLMKESIDDLSIILRIAKIKDQKKEQVRHFFSLSTSTQIVFTVGSVSVRIFKAFATFSLVGHCFLTSNCNNTGSI